MSFRPNILHVLFFQRAGLSVRAPVVSCKLVFASSWLILPVNLVFQDLEDQIQEETGKVNHLNKVKAKLEQEIDEVGLSQSRNLYVTSQIVSWKSLSIVRPAERSYLNLSSPRFLPVLPLRDSSRSTFTFFIVLLFQATDHWEREKKARADVEKVKRKIEGDLKVRKRKGKLELFGLFSEGMI